MRPLALACLAAVSLGCGRSDIPAVAAEPAPTTPVEVVARFPHDAGAFTQGLLIEEGRLYESTGGYGFSTLRLVDLATGVPSKQVRLSDRVFAEGLAAHGDRLIQLTWQAGVAIAYDRATFRPVAKFRYRGEGWGLTSDGERLYMSDGTATVTLRDPQTFAAVGQIRVTDAGRPVSKLNELEWVDGELYANVWFDPRIARIDPESGGVRGWIDCTPLVREYRRDEQAVLNGIAYDRDSGRLFVTGKDWPALIEIARPAATAD